MGPEGAVLCLDAGANDLGGVLMNESITRAAGAAHGQELSADTMRELILSVGREPFQRSTDYGAAGQGPLSSPATAREQWRCACTAATGASAQISRCGRGRREDAHRASFLMVDAPTHASGLAAQQRRAAAKAPRGRLQMLRKDDSRTLVAIFE